MAGRRILLAFEKHQQLRQRHAPAFIRHGLAGFCERTLTATAAAHQLNLSPSRLYALATAYRLALAKKSEPLCPPGTSGDDHAKPWPPLVLALLQKRLACTPPCP